MEQITKRATICQHSVSESIVAFLNSEDWMDAVKNANCLGGDADTMACIAGCIARVFYSKIPKNIAARVREGLTPERRDMVD